MRKQLMMIALGMLVWQNQLDSMHRAKAISVPIGACFSFYRY